MIDTITSKDSQAPNSILESHCLGGQWREPRLADSGVLANRRVCQKLQVEGPMSRMNEEVSGLDSDSR